MATKGIVTTETLSLSLSLSLWLCVREDSIRVCSVLRGQTLLHSSITSTNHMYVHNSAARGNRIYFFFVARNDLHHSGELHAALIVQLALYISRECAVAMMDNNL